ncbi:hypothetical protein DV096_02300 [Bradymonadaceae bacterium TMQ3]|nr:hypothetical protein DV096_02300 [Bradymonadaceae bacterium TMQ3]TXC77831.1 hypothetical protein FRC91_03605 [Bradymonadales bacterium TMQ1]
MKLLPLTTMGKCLVGWAARLALVALIVWFVKERPPEALTSTLVATSVCVPLVIGLLPGVWRRRADAPPAAAGDLERRRKVWDVLSELYLDTELVERDYARIAAIFAESGYNACQIEEILYREVHPVLRTNLTSVAGEWAGFDLEWLEAQILRRRRRHSDFAIIPAKSLVRGSWAIIEAQLQNTLS